MSENALLEKMLDLPDFTVTDLKHNEHDIRIYVEMKKKPSLCPQCGIIDGNFRVHGSREQDVRDLNIMSKHVGLMYKHKRYKCMECGATFYELCDYIEPKGRMTKRLREYIAKQSKRRAFIELERELDISNVTIREIFMEELATLQSGLDIETPEFIGIDEIHIERRNHRKAAWAVICNGIDHTVMDILPNRNQDTIENYFRRLKNPLNVKVVTMDMWDPYRTAVYKTLPNADIVVDKYHVDSMANDALNLYRKSLKKQLGERNIVLKKDRHVLLRREDKLNWTDKVIREVWFKEIPELETMYNLKEEFFKIYDKTKNKRQGIEMYEQWKKSIPEGTEFYNAVLTALENWKHEITNYFVHRVNNAFVEGANSAIRAIESQGRGYDFDVLRAKVMFCIRHKVVVPKYGTNTFSRYLFEDYSNKDYGVTFKDIVQAINEGLL